MKTLVQTSTSRRKSSASLEWLRYITAYLILTYGTRKLIGGGQFALGATLSSKPVGSLSGFELTWFYYGYSHVYGIILGLTQIFGGVLLLFRKSTLLGAAVLMPVMANILMINIFFHIALGAEIAAAFLLGSTMLLLWREREAIISLFWRDQPSETGMKKGTQKAALAIVVLLVLAQVFVFAKYAAR
ncbi:MULTISPECIES: hypothetical protein [Acidobacteriaceae]|uniref:hypothetical protein n=1 Tax=Acidobacteriaceae TaxID=204434 RepID=UPI00131D4493|nr:MULTISPECIES: hypothetical protein [Acidobacteriaceae]MDW5266593.1 hypothetical protein [Edaphobacter sp.]